MEYPPIGDLEYQTAMRALEDCWEKDMDAPKFYMEETDEYSNYLLKKDIMLPGLKYPSTLLFTLSAHFEALSSYSGGMVTTTTYYQKVNVYVPTMEISNVLDISIPMGVQLGHSQLLNFFARAFHVTHKRKQKKRHESLKKFTELENKRGSVFWELIRRIKNPGYLSLANNLGGFWSRKVSTFFVLRLVPFWGKTIVQARFIPYMYKSKLDESRLIAVEGIPREVSIWKCHRKRIEDVVAVLNHAHRLIEQFDVGGKQAVNVLSMGGLLQYEIMKMAHARYTPDETPLSLRDLIEDTELANHLRKRLNNDVVKGKWGQMEPKIDLFEGHGYNEWTLYTT